MTDQNPEVDETSDEPTDKPDLDTRQTKHEVDFSVDETNHDYAKGVFARKARDLQVQFVELYQEDPSAEFRLTLERL